MATTFGAAKAHDEGSTRCCEASQLRAAGKDDAPNLPGQPAMTENNTLEDEAWATPAVEASGADATSTARNEVLRYITRKNLRRPAHNIERNNTQNARHAASQA